MTEQLFFSSVEEYRSQLKKYGLQLEFTIEIRTNGFNMKWPVEKPPQFSGNMFRLPCHIDLVWEGAKIGDYYCSGQLDIHQQTINQLLLDNLVTKIQIADQARRSLGCGIDVLNSAITAIEAKDQYTRGHSDRVAQLALEIANRLDVDTPSNDVEFASKLHDIGKIGISELILSKPGILTQDELNEIRKHPEIGAQILKPLGVFEHLVPVILHHHEKFNGTGYPYGLVRNDIPLLSRIIAVADTFDALTSNRPYRNALTLGKAREIMLQARGSQLDPYVVDTFLSLPQSMLPTPAAV